MHNEEIYTMREIYSDCQVWKERNTYSYVP